MTRLVAALALLAMITADAVGQQRRDLLRPSSSDTASLSGVVSSEGPEPIPLRRARVTIHGAELEFARTAITDDQGAFSFEGLPAGRYTVQTMKDGYSPARVEARRPRRSLSIELSSGAAMRLEIRMERTAVITGRVLDPDGEPAAGVAVLALAHRQDPATGVRRLESAAPAVITDDRGEYRIYNLQAGSYYVRAQPRYAMVPSEAGLRVLTDAEIRAALEAVKTSMTSSRPGIPVPRPLPPAISAEPRRSVTLAPIYFPGTPISGSALPVQLSAAEVRTGVDIDLDLVAVATIEGIVGPLPRSGRVVVSLSHADRSVSGVVRSASAGGEDGRFAFRGIPPGAYTISARAVAASPGGVASASVLWGMTDVILQGEDLAGVTVAMQPGLSISGTLAFESANGSTPQLGAFRLPQLRAANVTFGSSGMLPPIEIDGTSFLVAGLIPGTYRFTTSIGGIRTPIGQWWLKSFRLKERELLDQELDLRESATDATITFSDRASELTGTVRDAAGLLVRDGMVVVFSADPRYWFIGSRYVAATRAAADGRYVVRNLPPGEYCVAVAGELLLPHEAFDPEILEELRSAATRVRIVGDEKKIHDLALAR